MSRLLSTFRVELGIELNLNEERERHLCQKLCSLWVDVYILSGCEHSG